MRPSRQMLSGEIVCSLFAFGYASAAAMPGELASLIVRREGRAALVSWIFALGVPALWLAIVDLVEWFRPTDGESIVRSRLVLVQGMCWSYAFHLMVVAGRPFCLISAHAVVGAVFCAVSYLENRRVRREIRARDSAPSGAAEARPT